MSKTTKVGRPTIITPIIVNKLCEAFKVGLNTQEACRFADISRQVYYSRYKQDDQFHDKIESAKDHLKLKALSVVESSISNGNINTAKWYLERKYRNEFGEDKDENYVPECTVEQANILMAILKDVQQEVISSKMG